MPLAAGIQFQKLASMRGRGQQQATKPIFWPAMQGGINAVSAASAVPFQDALLMVNMIPAEAGVKIRKGYVEYCTKVPLGDGIKTLIPFNQAAVASPVDRLFAVTSDGIYDVSTAGAAPVKKFDFPIKSGNAGWCSWSHYTTIAGQFIVMCDEANGYHVYTASTNTWAVGSITGVTVGNLVHLMVWKNRIWLVERDTGTAWYLPVGQISGAAPGGINDAKAFIFGNKFKFGGYLKSLWNWTLDGGEGVDDYLVALSSAGDMLVYQGTDPSTVGTFNMKGSWYIGRMHAGRRQCGDMGGELLIATNYGVFQASKLISGQPATDETVSVSYKINPRINAVAGRMSDTYGWELIFAPREQFIMLVTPKETGFPQLQFVYNTATRAWTTFNDLPVKTAVMWKNKLHIGTEDNRVVVYDGWLDKVFLNPADGAFEPVQWECLTSYQGFNAPATFKRCQFLRPLFIGQANPNYKIVARYDFNLSPPAGSPIFPPTAGGVWGVAVWGFSTWGGGYVVTQAPKGASGMGRYIALYLRGRSASELTHVGTDALFDMGGML